jgi:hypothetical protein
MIHLKRTEAFGDVLWVEPIARHFIEKGFEVNVVTNYPEVFDHYPSRKLTVSKHRLFKHLFSYHDRLIDLDQSYEMMPKMHILEAYQKASAIPTMEYSYPKIYLSPEEKIRKIADPYVVLHLECNPLNYRNVYMVNWRKIVSFLHGKGLSVIQISKNGENIYGDWIKTANFREIMSLIYHAKLFIGLDSGPSHIASSLDIPALLFFGSVNPHFRHLQSFRGKFLQGFCEYAHCYHSVPLKKTICPLVGERGIPKCCIHDDTSVIQAIDQLLYRYAQ